MARKKKSKDRAWLSWSSGKDAAWTLHECRRRGNVQITGLLTVITETFHRVSMHAVREDVLDAQAEAVGVPLHKAYIPFPCSNEQYEAVMAQVVQDAKDSGVTAFAFGDLFLEDVRKYREEKLAGTGMKPIFPLWGSDTKALAKEMIEGGLKACITCLDPKKMPKEFAGRVVDEEFLRSIPAGVDPCGENGEFHTFAFAGPMFSRPLDIVIGETVERDGFVFTDVLLKKQ